MGAQSRIRRERRQERAGVLPAWTPFERAVVPTETPESRAYKIGMMVSLAASGGRVVDRETAERVYDDVRAQERWINSRYQVTVDRRGGDFPVVHLSIKRHDKEPPGQERWRDFQRIKDEIVGPEYEAAELFPAAERLVDTANQYHLWVAADPEFRFPFGFDGGLVVGPDETNGMPGHARQRPFDDGENDQ
jgi:hypothetical protein